jgi:hypothetical protein
MPTQASSGDEAAAWLTGVVPSPEISGHHRAATLQTRDVTNERRTRMRLFAAFMGLAILGGCTAVSAGPAPSVDPSSLGSSSAAPSAVATSAPGPGLPAVAPSPAVDPSAAGAAYVAAVKAAGRSSMDDASILKEGRDFCTLELDSLYAKNPMGAVAAMIESPYIDDLAITFLCQQYEPALAVAVTGFGDGIFTVVTSPSANRRENQIRPGTYKTMGPAKDCSWKRTAAGKLIGQGSVGAAPDGVTVTIMAGEVFVSHQCMAWLPTG